jgi:hypothetical protein
VKRKLIRIILICTCTVLLLTACGAGNQQILGTYLEPYEQEAIVFLQGNEKFVELYGSDCTLDGSSFSFSYLDPQKYTGISLSPKIPATAEEFKQEIRDLQVNFYLPDNRTCAVRFEKTPEGILEITGWEYTDESDT